MNDDLTYFFKRIVQFLLYPVTLYVRGWKCIEPIRFLSLQIYRYLFLHVLLFSEKYTRFVSTVTVRVPWLIGWAIYQSSGDWTRSTFILAKSHRVSHDSVSQFIFIFFLTRRYLHFIIIFLPSTNAFFCQLYNFYICCHTHISKSYRQINSGWCRNYIS